MLAQKSGDGQCDGSVPIVSAGMHLAIHLRTVVYLIRFVNGQGVHVGTNGQSFSTGLASFSAQQPYDSRLSDTGLHFQTKSAEPLGNDARGAYLLKGQFWMPMQVPTCCYKIGYKLIDLCFQAVRVGYRHSYLPNVGIVHIPSSVHPAVARSLFVLPLSGAPTRHVQFSTRLAALLTHWQRCE